jgi:hypothetical protein
MLDAIGHAETAADIADLAERIACGTIGYAAALDALLCAELDADRWDGEDPAVEDRLARALEIAAAVAIDGPDAVLRGTAGEETDRADTAPPPPPLLTPAELAVALDETLDRFAADALRHIAAHKEWQARQAAIAEEYAPRSPERRRALLQARREMAAAHGPDWCRRGRRVLLDGAAGSGKTTRAALRVAHVAAEAGATVAWFAKDVRNAEAIARQVPAGVSRGRGRPNPADPTGGTMCLRAETAEKVARAGLPVQTAMCNDGGGKICPKFAECPYQRERARLRSGEVRIIAGAHEYIPIRGGPMPTPDLVVIDERCLEAMVGRVEFGLDRLLPDAMPEWQAAGLEAALAFRRMMDTLRKALTEPNILAALRARGITAPEHFDPAIDYARKAEEALFTHDINPLMDDGEVADRIDRLQHSEIGSIRRLLTALRAEIVHPRDIAHAVEFLPNKPVTVDGSRERQSRIVVHYLNKPAFPDHVPVLLLDHSGDIEVVRRLFGDRVEHIPLRCERNLHVVQVTGSPFSRRKLLGGTRKDGEPISAATGARAKRLRGEVVAFTKAVAEHHGDTFLATYKPLEEMLAPLLGPGVTIGHFGAIRSRNDYEHCAAGIIAGREQTWATVPEGFARALHADSPEPLNLTGEYTKQVRHIRMRDGSTVPVETDVHPDPRVQRIVALFRERESEQAADRLRLIYNAEVKTLYILSNLPLDITVDRVVAWPDLLREMTGQADNGVKGKGRRTYASPADLMLAAGGVVFGNPGDAARAYPELWPDRAGTGGRPEAARKAFQRARLGTLPIREHYAECPQPLRAAAYQRAGAGCRKESVWFDPARVADIRAWLQDRLGPLAPPDPPPPNPPAIPPDGAACLRALSLRLEAARPRPPRSPPQWGVLATTTATPSTASAAVRDGTGAAPLMPPGWPAGLGRPPEWPAQKSPAAEIAYFRRPLAASRDPRHGPLAGAQPLVSASSPRGGV